MQYNYEKFTANKNSSGFAIW